MNRQSATVHIVCLFAEQVEQLGINHGDQEIKGRIRIRHNQEQRRFLVSEGIQLQFVIGSYISDFLNIKRGKSRTAGNQNTLCRFTGSQLVLLVLTNRKMIWLFLFQSFKHQINRVLELLIVLTHLHCV